jgi:hypothetical protein
MYFPKKTGIVVLSAFGVFLVLFLIWQFSLKVPTQGNWQTPLAVQSTAEFKGDRVTVRNVRNFRYAGSEREEDLRPVYDDRTYDLNKVRKVWYVTEPFKGLPIAAHTFLSFEFSDGNFLSISIEARKKKGQVYNLFKGVLHTYPLMYIAADERDVILMRANIRKNTVYLYPVKLSKPEEGKILLRDMLERMNDLVIHPKWYNTLWANCTSSIAWHVNRIWPGKLGVIPWEVWVSGYADRLAFKRGLIDTDLPLDEARIRFDISKKSQLIGDVQDYSKRIRE